MGTRSLTFVTENESMPIICMYRQMDGYPSGHGLELYNFLNGMRMVNGIGIDNEKIANGTGCLAAQIVAHFKKGPGGIYLHRPQKHMDCWQDYEYWIDASDSGISIRVFSPRFDKANLLFSGSVDDFKNWIDEESE